MATIPLIISTSRSLPKGSWRWPNFLGSTSLRCSDIPAQLVSALIQKSRALEKDGVQLALHVEGCPGHRFKGLPTRSVGSLLKDLQRLVQILLTISMPLTACQRNSVSMPMFRPT